MWYDLNNAFEKESFILRAKKLAEDGAMVELSEKKARSMNQNAYLHLAISYFALQLGYTAQEVKDEYFKRECNPDLFVRTRYDELLGRNRQYLLSTRSLTKEETATAIDRFLHFAAQHGVYIAPSDEYISLLRMQQDVQRNKKYL